MKNVILISHSLIPSVLLCGHSQLTYLKNQGMLDYKFINASKIETGDLNWSDIIVFVRSESYLEEYVSRLCKGKKHLIYVMDDDLLNLPKYASSAKYYSVPGIHKNIEKIIKNCDTFLSPSPVLLEKYGNYCNNCFLIDEPSLNSVKDKKQNKKIKIGFAGSIDRTQDINEILTDTLEEIISKYSDKVDIEFMGARPNIVDKYKLKYIPYQNGYKKYTQIVGEANWDIGLAPMPVSDFHSCKYFNKYVEYASFGIAGIYTNCKPYIFGIKNRVNGILVNNTKDEWINGISELIENEELRISISNKSIEEANGKYSLSELSKQYLERVTFNFINNLPQEQIEISIYQRLYIILEMLRDKMAIMGWKFPVWCIKYIVLKMLDILGLYNKEKKEGNNEKR